MILHFDQISHSFITLFMQSQSIHFALWETVLCRVCSVVYTHCRNSTRRITISVFTHNPHISFFTNPSNLNHHFNLLHMTFLKSNILNYTFSMYTLTHYMLFLEECKVIFKYNPLTNWRSTHQFWLSRCPSV